MQALILLFSKPPLIQNYLILLLRSPPLNRYSNPGTVLYSFSPASTTFGSLIQSNPNQYSFVNIQDGNYPYFDIQFYSQDFQPLQINDTNLVVMLLIKQGHQGVISY